MADAMAIVGAAVFRKARTASGGRLGPRRVYPTDRYGSSHAVLRAKLTGDLYLVSVVDERLWLVGVLHRPVHDGTAWVAQPNEQPIVDLTSIVPELRFDTGSGVSAEKMASSLQTPRGLTSSDVALIRRAIDRAAADRPTPAQIEDAVVRLTARILGRTEDAVRADPGPYAAYHWDDGFLEAGGFDDIDWATFELPAAWSDEPPGELYGRCDFDLRRSRFLSEALRADRTTDLTLRGLLVDQDEYLYGVQLAALLDEKRLRLADLDVWKVDGRLIGGERLVEVMTAVWMLGDFDRHRLEPGEFAEVDPEWAPALAAIEPPSLRAHLSVFFQTPMAARCTGALFEPGDDEVLARWWIGEGQGCCTLTRPELIRPVPPFTRHAPIRRRPPPPGSRPGPIDEILATPFHQRVADLDPHDLLELPGPSEAELRARITSDLRRDPHLHDLMSVAETLIEAGEARAALSLVAACADRVAPERAVAVEHARCHAASALRCWDEALAAAERTLALWRPGGPIAESAVHDDLAWCALHLGQLDRALLHAEKAVGLDPDDDDARATRADVWFARGDTNAARKAFEQLMRAGVDPEATLAACADPTYRKLATKYRFPIELTDAEAAELGV